jgi:hypothetical protein
MKKLAAGVLVILFGSLAFLAYTNKPDINGPEFWKGCPNITYGPRPRPNGPLPTPVLVAIQKINDELPLATTKVTTNPVELAALSTLSAGKK